MSFVKKRREQNMKYSEILQNPAFKILAGKIRNNREKIFQEMSKHKELSLKYFVLKGNTDSQKMAFIIFSNIELSKDEKLYLASLNNTSLKLLFAYGTSDEE